MTGSNGGVSSRTTTCISMRPLRYSDILMLVTFSINCSFIISHPGHFALISYYKTRTSVRLQRTLEVHLTFSCFILKVRFFLKISRILANCIESAPLVNAVLSTILNSPTYSYSTFAKLSFTYLYYLITLHKTTNVNDIILV